MEGFLMNQHDFICSLKQLADELQKTPTQSEFLKRAGKGAARFRIFWPPPNSWNKFVEAAALPQNKIIRKIDSSIFNVEIDKHLENYEPRDIPKREPYPSMAIISDIHWPFHSQKVIDRFLEFVGDVKPEYIFLNGDAWDMYAHSKFPKSLNIYTPRDEENLSRDLNVKFWKEVYIRSPLSKGTQKTGNHDFRPMKRVLEQYPEAEDWISDRLKKLFTFDNVISDMDPRNETIIGDIAIFHGYLSQLGSHRDFTMYNAIVGHTHKPGIVYRQLRDMVLWEMNSGYAGDPEAKGLSYTSQKITNWVNAFGAVDKDGPRIIHV